MTDERASSSLSLDVLVVDDHVDHGETLRALLEVIGCSVRTVYDAASVAKAAADVRPRLALVDIVMPGVSGLDLARSLRAQPGWSAVRLVAMTGLDGEEQRQRSLAAGFDEHWVKPVAYVDLIAILVRAGLVADRGAETPQD